MLFEKDKIRVLAVSCPVGGGDGIGTIRADSARSALAALRGTPVELLVTGCCVEGLPVWPLAEKIRRVRPRLRWWLVARGITAADEVLARTLGVTRILDAAPTAEQVRSVFRPPTHSAQPSVSPPAAHAVGLNR